ncbi:hypothetical protein ACI77O_12400 [Pseudomonas tritici]|uniref:hypothetical protein n=1 Tax=Pseudomonas tritici TaxID=2745518 RepID=UPI00387ADE55
MSLFNYPLIFLPVVITEPGEYLTRCGDTVTVATVSDRHDLNNKGSYNACGTDDSWHKSGRILGSRETANDIICRA